MPKNGVINQAELAPVPISFFFCFFGQISFQEFQNFKLFQNWKQGKNIPDGVACVVVGDEMRLIHKKVRERKNNSVRGKNKLQKDENATDRAGTTQHKPCNVGES